MLRLVAGGLVIFTNFQINNVSKYQTSVNYSALSFRFVQFRPRTYCIYSEMPKTKPLFSSSLRTSMDSDASVIEKKKFNIQI